MRNIILCSFLGAVTLALPDAEADPYLLYGYGHPYNFGYNPYFTHPIVKPSEEVEANTKTQEETNNVVTPLVYPYGYSAYHGYPHHYYGKRDAEPEADPYLVYGYGHPYNFHYNPYFNHAVVKPVEVEADTKAVEDKEKVAKPLVFHPYGHPLYNGYTHHYYGKRDAEPEANAEPEAKADPYLLYGGHRHYGYGGYGYGGYRYGGYSPYYGGYRRYGGHYYGKREAEAEPEAKADPYLIHGYGGYPFNYGYPTAYHPYLTPTLVKPVETPAVDAKNVDAENIDAKKDVTKLVYPLYGLNGYHRYGYPIYIGSQYGR